MARASWQTTEANIYWKGRFENRGAFNPIGGGGGAKNAPLSYFIFPYYDYGEI